LNLKMSVRWAIELNKFVNMRIHRSPMSSLVAVDKTT
jgi:hypothetical protein